jgi:hypothetical protein
MCRQKFKAVPRKAEARRPGALGIIEQRDARLFDSGLSKVARIGEPKLKCGASPRDLASRWFHAIACPPA